MAYNMKEVAVSLLSLARILIYHKATTEHFIRFANVSLVAICTTERLLLLARYHANSPGINIIWPRCFELFKEFFL